MLADSRIIPYLGAFAFHCWDVLDASDDDYRAIAEIGKSAHKPIWCTEAGFDSALWQAPNAWPSWGNGLNTARAYAKALRLSGASSMDYWTYEDNYPLVSSDGLNPFPVFSVIDQMQRALPSGVTIVATQSGSDDIEALASIGPTRGRYSVLLVNSAGPGEVALSGLPPHSAVSVYVSDANARERKLDWPTRTSQAGALSLALPQRCVVTVIGRGE
jgi:hypothetical protein